MPGHQTDQGLRFVRVQLIDNEDPTGPWIGRNDRFHVVGEVGLGPGRPQPCLYDPTRGHGKTGNQGQRAVPDVFKFAQGGLACDHRTGLVLALKRLYASLLIGWDDMDAGLRQLQRRQVQGTDRLDRSVERLWIERPLVIEPIPPPMGFEVGLVLKNAPPSGGKSSRQRLVFQLLGPVRGASIG